MTPSQTRLAKVSSAARDGPQHARLPLQSTHSSNEKTEAARCRLQSMQFRAVLGTLRTRLRLRRKTHRSSCSSQARCQPCAAPNWLGARQHPRAKPCKRYNGSSWDFLETALTFKNPLHSSRRIHSTLCITKQKCSSL